MTEKIEIMVAAHKIAPMPVASIYTPLQVGAALSSEHFPEYTWDDTGDNISIKNKQYNELTALYWARHNSQADIVGLVHYRRYFTFNRQKNLNTILSEAQLRDLLQHVDVIVPKKRHYWIESSESHYRHAHHGQSLDILREVIQRDYPDYNEAFEANMASTSAHMFNMLIMRRQLFNDYVDWLFDILDKVEHRLSPEVQNWSVYERRVYGFLSERLLDVWLTKHQIKYQEVPVVFMEHQNWLKKGTKFLARKFGFGRVQ